MARFEVKQRDNKGMGKFASVFLGDSIRMDYFIIAPLISGGYIIKRSHPSLDLNGSKIHTIYLVEF